MQDAALAQQEQSGGLPCQEGSRGLEGERMGKPSLGATSDGESNCNGLEKR